MTAQTLTNLERRIIEAKALSSVFDILCARLDREQALSVICESTKRSAFDFGAAYARTAPDGPSLEHFATILDFWSAGDALRIVQVKLEEKSFSFKVTRCVYVERYREMGLADDLIYCLSCARDGAFAQAYSPRLSMERTQTISRDAPSCVFRFTWRT